MGAGAYVETEWTWEPPVRGPIGAVGLDGMGAVTTAQGMRDRGKCP